MTEYKHSIFEKADKKSAKEILDKIDKIMNLKKDVFFNENTSEIYKIPAIESTFTNEDIEKSQIILEIFKKYPVIKNFYEANKDLNYGFFNCLNRNVVETSTSEYGRVSWQIAGILESLLLQLGYVRVMKNYLLLLDIFYKFFFSKTKKIPIKTCYSYGWGQVFDFSNNFFEITNGNELILLENLSFTDMKSLTSNTSRSGIVNLRYMSTDLFSSTTQEILDSNELNTYISLFKVITNSRSYYDRHDKEHKRAFGEKMFDNFDDLIYFFESHI